MICLPDRESALRQLEEFMEKAPLYARDRNHVVSGHPAVSKLSPAIRHRVITEAEVIERTLERHSARRVEKWLQEVVWRLYWKAWLGLRPEVWKRYREALREGFPEEERVGALRVEAGEWGNPIVDGFARELAETGYLHNHARMWVAAWWIHQARLPWQLGAAWFERHLLDADPAANTLSWRWVAGLHTKGKTYLARRSNLEKYLAAEWLEPRAEGLVDFEQPKAWVGEPEEELPSPGVAEQEEIPDPERVSGLWLHPEDLSPECSGLSGWSLKAIAWMAPREETELKQRWLDAALADARSRARRHWEVPEVEVTWENWVEVSQQLGIQQWVALRPQVGKLADSVEKWRERLESAGIRLVWVDRPEDRQVMPYATRGYFPFWEKARKVLIGG